MSIAVEIFTAASVNGMITPARGLSSLGLIDRLDVPASILERQRAVRRLHDAVLVGPGTVLTDDPTLTSHAAPGHEPVRATVDPTGRIPQHFRFLDGSVRTLVGVSNSTPPHYLRLLEERGVEAVFCGKARVDLPVFLAELEERGIESVLVEGGGRLNRALLDQELVDRIHLMLIPAVLDSRAVNLFEGGAGDLKKLRFAGCETLEAGYLLLRYDLVR